MKVKGQWRMPFEVVQVYVSHRQRSRGKGKRGKRNKKEEQSKSIIIIIQSLINNNITLNEILITEICPLPLSKTKHSRT